MLSQQDQQNLLDLTVRSLGCPCVIGGQTDFDRVDVFRETMKSTIRFVAQYVTMDSKPEPREE